MANDKHIFKEVQEKIISSILAKFKDHYRDNDRRRVVNLTDLEDLCSDEEKKFINYFLSLNPRDFGFKGGFLGLTEAPDNLVMIKGQKITADTASLDDDGAKGVISPQFLPEDVFQAYQLLDQALYKKIRKHLIIESGYRSPAYQLITLFAFLLHHNFDTDKVFKLVAFPGYSEHGFPPRQALDLMTKEGIPTIDKPLDFVNTKEYKWLLDNANNYGFYLSYPENNPDGITFEPWHWHYEK